MGIAKFFRDKWVVYWDHDSEWVKPLYIPLWGIFWTEMSNFIRLRHWHSQISAQFQQISPSHPQISELWMRQWDRTRCRRWQNEVLKIWLANFCLKHVLAINITVFLSTIFTFRGLIFVIFLLTFAVEAPESTTDLPDSSSLKAMSYN